MEETYYSFKNEDTGQFIAIDQGSGGYPYDTSLKNAHKFFSPDRAFEYHGVINPKEKWILHLVILTIKSVELKNLKKNRYDTIPTKN